MKQQRQTQLVRRLQVVDTSGNVHRVDEMGDFVRVQSLEGTWSNWARAGGRYLLNRQHVNPTDDPNTLELAMTGERLTVLNPKE
jgi:hypothetical protein